MTKKFLINNSVLYMPDIHCLALRSDPNITVQLNAPASRCLLLLIERKGTIVSQQEFFEYAWENYGTYVTANTFYQNISLLRKGLKMVGITDNLIKSFSKQGLMLIENTVINRIDNNIVSPLLEKSSKKNSILSFITKKIAIAIISLIISLSISTVIYFTPSHFENNQLTNYLSIEKSNHCNFLVPKDKKTHPAYIEFIRNNTLPCTSGQSAYITISKNSLLTTALICDNDIMLNRTLCNTHYYVSEPNEK